MLRDVGDLFKQPKITKNLFVLAAIMPKLNFILQCLLK